MCTATWIHDNDGYQLLFNRDEKLTRKPATPPWLAIRDGVRYLAPADGDFGGTWIATNEFGVSVCLLNGANLTGSRSRGLLLLDLISSPSVAAICERIHDVDLAVFAPFTLAALEPSRPAALIEWNGSQKGFLSQAAPHFMLTSSSFDAEAVRRQRQEHYARSSGIAFHRSHDPAPSAYSTCMHRPDAETVSFSWIRVSDAGTDFFYTPGAPCREIPGVHMKLARGGC